MKRFKWLYVAVVAVLLAGLGTTIGIASSPELSIDSEGLLSLEAHIALAAQTAPNLETTRYSRDTIVTEETWGYKYILENGDIVEVGDNTTTDFKAHIKTTRWNGVASFSWWQGTGTFSPTLVDDTISFDYNNDIHIQIYPVPPSERNPEGSIEYNVILNKKLAKPFITFDADWANITWEKLLALDMEYDQAACEEEWGVEYAPFTITPTSIVSDATGEILKTRAEYDVNSYEGRATNNWHNSSGDLGGGVTYSNVSRSFIHIHRGLMTDALNDTAWVEDIELDEVKKEITFHLPQTWLRNAEYPVSQVCGIDPAYTEDMDNWVSDTYGDSDATWSDYDLFTNKGVPKGAVAEIILTNLKANTEENLGVRTDGSSLSRYVQLHEAERGGVTTCRMFVVCHSTTGLIETYCDDVTDDQVFYLVGYWENVGFTERWDDETPAAGSGWEEEELADSAMASRVCHFIFRFQTEAALYFGVRNIGSALNRRIDLHEAEGGGESNFDMLTKADANYKVEIFKNDYTYNAGYFGSELDFVDLRQDIDNDGDSDWDAVDLTSYLDEDGRVCDFSLAHSVIDSPQTMGVRDGDDSSTNRYILEHEAEDNGTGTGEGTGFSMSAKSNASGIVNIYSSTLNPAWLYLMGYFKPAVAEEADIAASPAEKDFGAVTTSTTYWTGDSEPSWPLADGDAYFTITNNGDQCSITIKASNFVGGTPWTLGTPGENIARLTAFKEGDGSGDGKVLTTSPQAFISGLITDIDFEVKMETPTIFGDGVQKVSTVTLEATLD